MFVRLLVCGVVAVAIVLFGGGWLVHHFLGNEPKSVIGVEVVRRLHLITTGSTSETAKSDSREGGQARLQPGSVRVAFTIDQKGRAQNVRVLQANAGDINKAAAKKLIAFRRFEPSTSSQEAAEVHTEVIHFSAASPDMRAQPAGDGGARGAG